MQLPFFKKKAKSSGRVGVSVTGDVMALAHLEMRQGVPHLRQCQTVEIGSAREAGPALERLVKSMGLDGEQCSYVLDYQDYSMHLVEAPNVEPEELRVAMRWKVKDLLDMKVDDAAIDVFPVPDDAYRGRKMAYVVATQKAKIPAIVKMVESAGLELAIVDIPELAMRNVSSLYLKDNNGAAFMDLRRTGSTMNITRDGNLYLSRRINTQLDPEVMQSDDWPSLRDRLVLEIQRSLDYYESQMGKGQINRILIGPRQLDGEAMAEALNELLAAQVSPFNLADYLQSDVAFNSVLQQQALTAVGATLRGAKRLEANGASAPDIEDDEIDNLNKLGNPEAA